MKKVSCRFISYVFSREVEPVISIKPGETVVFETLDARGARSVPGKPYTPPPPRPFEKSNPVTGPVYVEGAEAGDVLAVEVKSIDVGEWGYVSAKPTVGVLKDLVRESTARAIRVHGGVIYFRENVTLPVRPMVGTIGVAPAEGSIHTIHPGRHGGNMDCNDVRAGSTVYLPVFVDGALFALGDVHASMGDGETSGGGLDISADVEVKIGFLKGRNIRRPMIKTEEFFVYTYNAGDLKTAVRGVVEEAVTHLSSMLHLSTEDAIMLVSTAGDVMISQACESPIDVTTRLRMPIEVYPKDADLP
ncbi:acetamidase/formamidase family protein [Candidatus Bathyarchaeota archaeon]|nr:acetamidase/formamidase family protein [Candidatus Bathyarchaeota archaeon]